jgi:modulator of FtsH protease
MNDELQRANPYLYGGAGEVAQDVRNRVLRNTYWLLSLSLIPTVLGAWVGLASGIALRGGVGILLVIAVFALIFAIQRFRNSTTGVVLLLGFTFLMGMLMSGLLAFTLHFANGPMLITLAFGGTALIFFSMATIATVSKRDFSGMGQWLMIGLIIAIVASLANIFLQLPALMLTVAVVTIIIFSGFMLFDVQRVVRGGETNYVTATLSIYLDLINVFQSLLMLLTAFGGSSRD